MKKWDWTKVSDPGLTLSYEGEPKPSPKKKKTDSKVFNRMEQRLKTNKKKRSAGSERSGLRAVL